MLNTHTDPVSRAAARFDHSAARYESTGNKYAALAASNAACSLYLLTLEVGFKQDSLKYRKLSGF